MAAQNSAGIQTLLEAEKEAQKIVQEAREYRTKRVKDARQEAQREIEEFRKKKEDEFQAYENKHTSGNRQAEELAEKETQKQLDELKALGDKSGQNVVDDLVKAVLTVNPQLPGHTKA